ncbi:MAG TPA: hypothetical protein VGO71_04310 [Baekduia sp.]|jgi:hypothetical protein|nr:hypothetical protein [Baekduia sp.]
MDFITILRALWRGRLLVVLATLLAVFAGLEMAYRVTPGLPPKLESRQYNVALGTVNVLVDTPDSQVIDLNPTGADAVSTRASLLASLISTSPIKNAIATRVGVPADRLVVLGPQAGATAAPASATKTAVAADGRRANIISIRTDATLPVISIDTQAPSAQEATRLADGAAAGLQDYLSTVVKTQKVPHARRLVLRQLGTPEVGISVRGPRKALGVAVGVFLLLVLCALIVLLPAIARALRAAAAEERAQAERQQRDRDADDGVVAALKSEDQPAGSRTFTSIETPGRVRAVDAGSASLPETAAEQRG